MNEHISYLEKIACNINIKNIELECEFICSINESCNCTGFEPNCTPKLCDNIESLLDYYN